jgi:2,3-bisphosphoglycerate-independent phosphoglycerate mutase
MKLQSHVRRTVPLKVFAMMAHATPMKLQSHVRRTVPLKVFAVMAHATPMKHLLSVRPTVIPGHHQQYAVD